MKKIFNRADFANKLETNRISLVSIMHLQILMRTFYVHPGSEQTKKSYKQTNKNNKTDNCGKPPTH